MDETETTRPPRTPRKRSRSRSVGHTEDYTVRLDPVTAEWAKDLPGGLSYVLRTCLQEMYDRARAEGRGGDG